MTRFKLITLRVLYAFAWRIEWIASRVQDNALGWCERLEDEYTRLEEQ